MSNKLRILFCAESSHLGSGFGVYTKELLTRLHKTNKYEIAEFSCYRTINAPKIEPWKIYPNAVDKTDPEADGYAYITANQFGQWRFDLVLLDFRPDIVVDIRDVWMLSYQHLSVLRPFYHWVIAPTLDSMPQNTDWINTYQGADTLLAHTKWAQENLHDLYPHLDITGVVSDSVDIEMFKPMSISKSNIKSMLGIDPQTFVIGSVMRNQKRKLIPDVLGIVKNLCLKHPDKKILLYLHTTYPEKNGWDIPTLLLEYDIADRVLFTYRCQVCKTHYCATYRGACSFCRACEQYTATIASVSNPTSSKDLAMIYNVFDVYVQYAICEGFGVPPVEAAACGIPVVTVDYGAMAEVGTNIGADLVPTQRVFRELESNTNRAMPDNEICENHIEKYMDLSDLDRMYLAEKIRKKLTEAYSWDKTTATFEGIFDSIKLTGLQGKWDSPKRMCNPKAIINKNENNRDFIYKIIDSILDEPQIKSTYMIQDIIRSLDLGYSLDANGPEPFDQSAAVKFLEIYMNNKMAMENIRVGELSPPAPAYLTYK